MGRSREGRRQDPAAARDQPQGCAALRQPRQAARGRQGRPLQRLRMGQLFARRGHQGQKPSGGSPLDRALCGAGGARRFANRQIGVPFFFGTHYLTLQMLEGFVPRDLIKLGRVPNGSPYRFKLLMDGVIDATTLTEPYISLAEKLGCRMVVAAFHHGTEVASDRVDAETYSAFNRAVREAVRRINANKRAYMHYFIDYYKAKDPEIAKLTIDDLRESRLYLVDPAPIPADELQRTYEWMKSWDFLETGCAPNELIDMNVQKHGYAPDAKDPVRLH